MLSLCIACNNTSTHLSTKTSPSKKDSLVLDSDAIKVINVAFDTTIGPDKEARKNMVPPPMPLLSGATKQDIADRKEDIKESKRMAQILDTAKIFVLVGDSLLKNPWPDFNEFSYIFSSNGLKENLPGLDSSFCPLIKSLWNPVKRIPFNISMLKSKYNYVLRYSSERKNLSTKLEIYSIVTMTNAIFNMDKTKACIYTHFYRGRKWANDQIVCLVKTSEGWKVTYIVPLTVS
jgi:hypothetical protein